MRYRLVVLGLLLVAGVAWLGLYASGEDTYYMTGVSRWEHSSRWGAGAAALVVAGFVVASAAALGCLARGLFPRRLAFALPVLPTVAAYLVAIVTAWYPLTGGH